MTYDYYKNCVAHGDVDVDWLNEAIDGNIQVSRCCFLQHVNREDLRISEEQLGYESHPSRGLTMAGDWHISYHRSKYDGRRCYYFRHSGIEFIFLKPDDLNEVSKQLLQRMRDEPQKERITTSWLPQKGEPHATDLNS